MDNYNQSFLQLLQPFIRVHISHELANTPITTTLIKYFDQQNVNGKVWDNCIIRNRLSSNKYIIDYDNNNNNNNNNQDDNNDSISIPTKEYTPKQHSILSPFNKDSDIFPNGILTHEWFNKYIKIFPFSLIYVCKLTDPSINHQLIAKITKLKQDLLAVDCKLTVIFVANFENSGSIDYDEQLINLRRETGLSKLTGLLLLLHNNNSTKSIDKDCEMIVNSILNTHFKQSSHEYYSQIEYKLKQRNKKYYSLTSSDINHIDTSIELTPKFLETRNLIKQGIIQQFLNPHNLEQSNKLLEIAYQSLITILNSIYVGNDNNNNNNNNNNRFSSSHDKKIIKQFRNLLDIMAFHIVRGYLSIEEPLKALKKHQTHILNVKSVINEDSTHSSNWESIQYEWLAQLMSLVPYSLITSLNSTSLINQKKSSSLSVSSPSSRLSSSSSSSLVSYFGGLRLPEFDVITNPGLIYLKAYELNQIKDKRIQLLIEAISELEMNQNNAMNKYSISGTNSLNSIISYINWLLAEEFYSDNKLSKAIDYYEMAYSSSSYNTTSPSSPSSQHGWNNISYLILEKLLNCYCLVGNKKLQLTTILKLSTIPMIPQTYQTHLTLSYPTDDDIFNYEDSLLDNIDIIDGDSYELFKVDTLIVNNDLTKRETNVHDDITVQIGLKSNLNHQKISHILLQHVQSVTNSGHFQIDSIKLQITIQLQRKEKCINLNKIELHQDFSNITNIGCYQISSTKQCKIRLDYPNNEIKIYPVKPDINIKPKLPIHCFIPGEKLSIPLEINYKNPHHHVNKQIYLMAKIKSPSTATTATNDVVAINWDGFKDDEPLNLINLQENDNIHTLYIFTRNWNQEYLNIELQTYTENENEEENDKDEDEDEDEVVVYDIATFTIPVLSKPFSCQYVITPDFRDKATDMPSPFILPNKTDHNMPIAVRLWEGKLKIIDEYKEFMEESLRNKEQQQQQQQQQLEIVDIEFNIVSKNPELIIDLINNDTNNTIENQQFITRSKSGFSHRNVTVVSSAIIKWKRRNHNDNDNDDDEIINEFETPEWEITLPLSEPRVLFRIIEQEQEQEQDAKHNNGYKLQYILENPTPRVFTFTTQLTDYEDQWIFNNSKNIVPLIQPPFPVLPFSRHYMDFIGEYLPASEVFDVQYKVTLPIVSVSKDITSIPKNTGNLYYKPK
ncbi:Gryzun, putative trafficking through Golgi family protein [Candida albicans]|uniref:Gryzun, putative trafficking through Golgi family protein n=1 Tax=Candida albicans TaxID=5476 RepID=A0A8H6C1G1_CANAX|nr:Gryzun, putative trafficking through Golgi family protein [Candida albicans]